MQLECKQCGGAMSKSRKKKGSLLVALLVLIVGIIITLAIPILGWIAGPIICLVALGMGTKAEHFWRCRGCGAVVPYEPSQWEKLRRLLIGGAVLIFGTLAVMMFIYSR